MSDRVASFVEPGARSTRDILRDVVRDVQDLLHSEVRLAKAEVTEQANRAKSVGGLIGGAAVAGLFAGMCFIAFCIALLAMAIPVWAASLIMAFLLGGAGAVLYARGRDRLRNFHAVPEQTVGTIKEDVAWVKQRTR
jgi:Flp pilus assembly protein TadB